MGEGFEKQKGRADIRSAFYYLFLRLINQLSREVRRFYDAAEGHAGERRRTPLRAEPRRIDRDALLRVEEDDIRARSGYRAVFNACLKDGLPIAQDKCETVPLPSPMFR